MAKAIIPPFSKELHFFISFSNFHQLPQILIDLKLLFNMINGQFKRKICSLFKGHWFISSIINEKLDTGPIESSTDLN